MKIIKSKLGGQVSNFKEASIDESRIEDAAAVKDPTSSSFAAASKKKDEDANSRPAAPDIGAFIAKTLVRLDPISYDEMNVILKASKEQVFSRRSQ